MPAGGGGVCGDVVHCTSKRVEYVALRQFAPQVYGAMIKAMAFLVEKFEKLNGSLIALMWHRSIARMIQNRIVNSSDMP